LQKKTVNLRIYSNLKGVEQMEILSKGESTMVKSKESITNKLVQASKIRMANRVLKLQYDELIKQNLIDKECSVYRLLNTLGLKVISKNTEGIVVTEGDTTAKVMYKHSFGGSILDFNSITLF
jgi:hypothetical protein